MQEKELFYNTVHYYFSHIAHLNMKARHDLKHLRYEKISSSGSTSATKGGNWCVTEKVHGANFSIYIQKSGSIRCAKRTGFIADDESFFNHYQVVEKYRGNIVRLSDHIFQRFDTETIVLFGEIFGGSYPIDGVICRKSAVQRGVWYSPNIDFLLFDICIDESPTEDSMLYLPFKDTVQLSKEHGLLCAEPLFVGAFNEALAYPPRFSSTIPARLGLSPLVDTSTPEKTVGLSSSISNIAEGIIVRPYEDAHSCGAPGRGMTKIKVNEFSEGDGCPPVSSDARHLADWVLSLVNPNRVAAAASKIGNATQREHWKAIVDEVLRDVAEECGAVSQLKDDDGFEQRRVDTDDQFSLEGIYYKLRDQIKYISYNILSASLVE